ncbi:UNVERIFIED_CONTAM: hypothetical protein PYX00_011472 [Menopon gallinae]|uniref:tryptophan--tRNA ligase n=1 Tax=Menopon gallinae TaxID=328185 RepID=A0AAW2H7J4_9NEOP
MDDGQVVTPWDVEGEKETGFDYKKLIEGFGCQEVDEALVQKVEKITMSKAHFFFRRKIVFAHRDMDKAIERPFYLYTGRGPSSGSLHLGHAIPLILTRYLQQAFGAPLVIQITDDEKFLWKKLELDQSIAYGHENIKDIIAFGFDPKKTFIFSNMEYSHNFYRNTIKVSKSINLNEAMKVFGFDSSSSIGQVEFPAKEIAPCFASSFPFLQAGMSCLIPSAIDQDPYFRLARDKACALNERKPAAIYSSFLPSLKGVGRKMSASDPLSSIYLTDTPEDIKSKILKFAFSGGKDTAAEHRRLGGDTAVDISFHYLRHFLESDEELVDIKSKYERGEMLTRELKNRCIKVLQDFVMDYQSRRARVTDEDVLLYKNHIRFSESV